MKPKTKRIVLTVFLIVTALAFWGLLQGGTAFDSAPQQTGEKGKGEAPAPGRATMLDLGADKCRPCKMMAPILEELEKAYADRAEIIFIDVWKNPEVAKEYGIRAIPTQIFFNKQGREVKRHTGFMDKKTIIKNLSALGVETPEKYRDS
ncbi:MAG: thioredoxin family protein [Desulfobacteraceae bacterium]|nr:thioredoxin family protein [Desulfobacteraceae bacterium]